MVGSIFGWLGWGLLRYPSMEVAGTVLFVFPAMLVKRGATDTQATSVTVFLYGLAGLATGALAGRFCSSSHRGNGKTG